MTGNDLTLLRRALDDDLTAAERQRLAALLDASPAARAERDRDRAVRRAVAAEASASFGPGFADRVMHRVERRPSAPARGLRRDRAPVTRRRRTAPLAWSVVALALVAVVGLALWLRPVTHAAPYGATAEVTLPDGSAVELSPGSQITYRRGLAGEARRVALEGQAFFEVTSDGRPFVVETFNARVEVLGTSFDVRAWPGDAEPHTAVAVATGRVAVRARAPGGDTVRMEARPPVRLAPGEATVVAADTTAARRPQPAALDRVLAWRSGGLDFRNAPLASVLATLERRFDVRIATASSAVEGRRLTYHDPRPGSAEAVLSAVCYSLDLRYRRTAEGFEVLAEDR